MKSNYYLIGEVSEILGIHRQTIRRLEKKKAFRFRRDYREYRIFNKMDLVKLKRYFERVF